MHEVYHLFLEVFVGIVLYYSVNASITNSCSPYECDNDNKMKWRDDLEIQFKNGFKKH